MAIEHDGLDARRRPAAPAPRTAGRDRWCAPVRPRDAPLRLPVGVRADRPAGLDRPRRQLYARCADAAASSKHGCETTVAVIVNLEDERGKPRKPSLDALPRWSATTSRPSTSCILAAHAEPGRADPAAGRPHHRRRRQAAAADADAGRRPAVRLSRHAPRRRSPPASSSSTPPPCCTTTWSTTATCAAASATANAVWGNKAQRAGRRLPVQPRLPAHGRRRLAARCSTSSPTPRP